MTKIDTESRKFSPNLQEEKETQTTSTHVNNTEITLT